MCFRLSCDDAIRSRHTPAHGRPQGPSLVALIIDDKCNHLFLHRYHVDRSVPFRLVRFGLSPYWREGQMRRRRLLVDECPDVPLALKAILNGPPLTNRHLQNSYDERKRNSTALLFTPKTDRDLFGSQFACDGFLQSIHARPRPGPSTTTFETARPNNNMAARKVMVVMDHAVKFNRSVVVV
jgi:hypothetical protein